MAELTPQHVLADLFDSDEWDALTDNKARAEMLVQRLTDAGFTIWESFRVPEDSR